MTTSNLKTPTDGELCHIPLWPITKFSELTARCSHGYKTRCQPPRVLTQTTRGVHSVNGASYVSDGGESKPCTGPVDAGNADFQVQRRNSAWDGCWSEGLAPLLHPVLFGVGNFCPYWRIFPFSIWDEQLFLKFKTAYLLWFGERMKIDK